MGAGVSERATGDGRKTATQSYKASRHDCSTGHAETFAMMRRLLEWIVKGIENLNLSIQRRAQGFAIQSVGSFHTTCLVK